MKSICLFSSYFNKEYIPYYIKFYLEELLKHFTEIVLITNAKQLHIEEVEYLEKRKISIKLVSNEGFDFGMWYKALNDISPDDFDRIALVNDSCVLFKSLNLSFEWINSNNLDYCGLVASRRIKFHIQSFFVIINKKAIQHALDYFKQNGIINDYQKVIYTYELGLCSYLEQQHLKTGAMYFSKEKIEMHNPSFFIIDDLIKEGIPVIKKKIIFRAYRIGEYLSLFRMNFNIDPKHYIENIKKANAGEALIDFDLVRNDFSPQNNLDIYKYNIFKKIYGAASKSKILSGIFHKMILMRRKWRGDTSKQIVKTSEPE